MISVSVLGIVKLNFIMLSVAVPYTTFYDKI
jgi:hypothetical protein